MPRLTKEQKARAHLCGIPGCPNPWSSTFQGKRCAVHNGSLPAKQTLTTPPVKPWSETEKDEE